MKHPPGLGTDRCRQPAEANLEPISRRLKLAGPKRPLFYTLLYTAGLLLALAACAPRPTRLGQDQVRDIAWRALEPNTATQSRSNWELRQAQKVNGREVVDQFTAFGTRKCPGPIPPENLAIRASGEYWYIQAVPKNRAADSGNEPDNAALMNSATPDGATPGATEPEPILQEATFLIDPFSGQVVARKFYCGD